MTDQSYPPRHVRDSDRTTPLTHGRADWAGLRVVVAGIGVSGFAAADALLERGAEVTVVDEKAGESTRERAVILETLGARLDQVIELTDEEDWKGLALMGSEIASEALQLGQGEVTRRAQNLVAIVRENPSPTRIRQGVIRLIGAAGRVTSANART